VCLDLDARLADAALATSRRESGGHRSDMCLPRAPSTQGRAVRGDALIPVAVSPPIGFVMAIDDSRRGAQSDA